MLLREKYRSGTPAWFLTSYAADQELQPLSQGPVVIYTARLKVLWLDGEKIATTNNKEWWRQELRDNKQGKTRFFPYISGKANTKKQNDKKGKNKEISTSNSTNLSGDIPTFSIRALLRLSHRRKYCQSCSGDTEGSFRQYTAKHGNLTTLVSDLTFHFPKLLTEYSLPKHPWICWIPQI